MGDEEAIFCRICLRIDITKKYILTDIAQRKFIETLFKENGYNKDLDDRSYACFECRTAMHKSYNFIQKSLRAQKLLNELHEKQDPLTYSLLESIDREKYNITSNLTFSDCESETLIPLGINLDINVTVKTESNDSQEDNTVDQCTEEEKNIDSNVVQNGSNANHLETCESIEHIDPYTKKLATVDSKLTPDPLTNFYIEPSCEEIKTEVGTETVIVLDSDDDVKKYDNKEKRDPLDIKPVENRRKSNSSVDIFSSDDISTLEKVMKRKRKKKKKKVVKNAIKRRKVTLNLLSSDEEVKKKRCRKVEWPAMPIFEERFRTRKNVDYSGLDEKTTAVDEKTIADKDFVPASDNSDKSDEDSSDSYDDKGKLKKKKTDYRVFPMECEECKSIIWSKKEYHYHYLQMHKDIEYPYKTKDPYLLCPECGESVSQKLWKEHKDKHAGIRIECDLCHKDYSSRTKMLQHKKRVHDINNKFVCDYCEKRFFLKCDMKRHIRTHTGEKPFKCHICDHRVAHKGNLYVHIRQIHQNIGPVRPPHKRQRKSRKKGTNDEEDSDENEKKDKKMKEKDRGKKKKNVQRKLKNRKDLEEKDSSKGKKKDGGERKRKRKRKVTDSESEEFFDPTELLESCELKDE